MEQLADFFYNGQYLTRMQYFARPETKQFYDIYGYMPWDMTLVHKLVMRTNLNISGPLGGQKGRII